MLFGYPPFYNDSNYFNFGKQEQNVIYDKIKQGFCNQTKDTQKYGLGPWFPSHISVSDEAKDLIAKLLQTNIEVKKKTHNTQNIYIL